MSDVITFLGAISTAEKQAAADLSAVTAAEKTANAAESGNGAGMTTGVGGSGLGATPGGSPSGGEMTGGMRGSSGVTVHAVGPGLAGDVINALKSLGGR